MDDQSVYVTSESCLIENRKFSVLDGQKERQPRSMIRWCIFEHQPISTCQSPKIANLRIQDNSYCFGAHFFNEILKGEVELSWWDILILLLILESKQNCKYGSKYGTYLDCSPWVQSGLELDEFSRSPRCFCHVQAPDDSLPPWAVRSGVQVRPGLGRSRWVSSIELLVVRVVFCVPRITGILFLNGTSADGITFS